MTNKSMFPDRLDHYADSILKLLIGMMLIFFTSFVFILANSVAAHATSQDKPPACSGKNLLLQYKNEDPKKYQALRKKADLELNGKSIFWKIEKDGTTASYLLGTMHMADERIAKLPAHRLAAFSQSDIVIVENVEALDPKQAASAMAKFRQLTLYSNGQSLADHLDEKTLAKLKIAAQKRGLPGPVIQIMKPWLVSTLVSLPLCEFHQKQAGAPVLDSLIVSKARSLNKTIFGLETISEQFHAMADLPEEFHLKSLAETLELGNIAEDVMETLKQLYLAGDMGMVFPFTQSISPETLQTNSFSQFKESLITNRNIKMAERALPYLEKGNAFIAVGALHLPGKTGLVEAFRRAGYTLSPAD